MITFDQMFDHFSIDRKKLNRNEAIDDTQDDTLGVTRNKTKFRNVPPVFQEGFFSPSSEIREFREGQAEISTGKEYERDFFLLLLLLFSILMKQHASSTDPRS